jgi:hypothetical protein
LQRLPGWVAHNKQRATLRADMIETCMLVLLACMLSFLAMLHASSLVVSAVHQSGNTLCLCCCTTFLPAGTLVGTCSGCVTGMPRLSTASGEHECTCRLLTCWARALHLCWMQSRASGKHALPAIDCW